MNKGTLSGFYAADENESEWISLRQDLRDEMDKKASFEKSLAQLRPGTSQDVVDIYKEAIIECNSVIRYIKKRLYEVRIKIIKDRKQ